MKVEKVQNYKILIVEDDRGLAQGIAMALKEENTLFLQAYSLEEARKLWKTEAPDMVLRARVERMRKRSAKHNSEKYEDSGYRFYFDQMKFFAGGQEITLSKTEQERH